MHKLVHVPQLETVPFDEKLGPDSGKQEKEKNNPAVQLAQFNRAVQPAPNKKEHRARPETPRPAAASCRRGVPEP